MYKTKFVPPFYLIYNENNEYIVNCHSKDNADLIRKILNYDSTFKRPCFDLKKHSKNSKITFEKLVDNNISDMGGLSNTARESHNGTFR